MKSIQNQPHILIIKFVKYNACIFNKTTCIYNTVYRDISGLYNFCPSSLASSFVMY